MYRILIVDDEPVIRKGVEKLIQQSANVPVATETAENGVEALQKIAANRPDFIFTDIRMPRMDGLELCKNVQEKYKDIAVVVISGYSDFEYAQKSVSYGVKEYILKPITRQGISETMKKLIEQSESAGQKGFIPMAAQEQWLEQLEIGVWYLSDEKIAEIMPEIKNAILDHSLELPYLRELVHELYQKLVKYLNRRDVYNFRPSAGLDSSLQSREQIFEWLEAEVEGLMKLIRSKRRGNAKDPMEEVKLYIERNLSRELSLEEVADMLGLNPSYFSQLFKQMTDETFIQYRIKRRMEKAKKLLAIPHYKITDISHEVGYADHPHFTKTFKKNTGYTPSEYREMLGID